MLYIAGGAAAVGLLAGWTVRDWKSDADLLAAQHRADKAMAEARDKLDKKAEEFEAFRQQNDGKRVETKNTLREIYRNVPVRTECASPPAAVGLLDSLVDQANSASSGQPEVSVSGAGKDAKPVRGPGA